MRHPEQPFVGSGKLHKEDEEKRQLRQRIKELEQENEFLKKYLALVQEDEKKKQQQKKNREKSKLSEN